MKDMQVDPLIAIEAVVEACTFRNNRPAVPTTLAHEFRSIRPNLSAAAERDFLMSSIVT